MTVDEKELTVIGFILTWAAGLIGVGKIYGSQSTILERHDMEIKELHKGFVTDDGEPRLVSYAAHDKIQAACQAVVAERHHALSQRLEQQDKKLDQHDKKLDQILAAVRGAKEV